MYDENKERRDNAGPWIDQALNHRRVHGFFPVSHKWNEKYYDTPGITPVDIFVKKAATNPGSQELRETIKKAEKSM